MREPVGLEAVSCGCCVAPEGGPATCRDAGTGLCSVHVHPRGITLYESLIFPVRSGCKANANTALERCY